MSKSFKNEKIVIYYMRIQDLDENNTNGNGRGNGYEEKSQVV